MAAMYAVYHGPKGIRNIAGKVHGLTQILAHVLTANGYTIVNKHYFDTLTIDVSTVGPNMHAQKVHAASVQAGINFRRVDENTVGVTLDESVGPLDLTDVVNVFLRAAGKTEVQPEELDHLAQTKLGLSSESLTASPAGAPSTLVRETEFLTQPVFNSHHSETEMMRYLMHLQEKDFSLVHGMIPLGSCTMKLNSTSSMVPLSWKEFGGVHPFAPLDQARGYAQVIKVSLLLDLLQHTDDRLGTRR